MHSRRKQLNKQRKIKKDRQKGISKAGLAEQTRARRLGRIKNLKQRFMVLQKLYGEKFVSSKINKGWFWTELLTNTGFEHGTRQSFIAFNMAENLSQMMGIPRQTILEIALAVKKGRIK